MAPGGIIGTLEESDDSAVYESQSGGGLHFDFTDPESAFEAHREENTRNTQHRPWLKSGIVLGVLAVTLVLSTTFASGTFANARAPVGSSDVDGAVGLVDTGALLSAATAGQPWNTAIATMNACIAATYYGNDPNIIQIRAIIQTDAQRRANFLRALSTTCNAGPIPAACGQINAAYAASAASAAAAPSPPPPVVTTSAPAPPPTLDIGALLTAATTGQPWNTAIAQMNACIAATYYGNDPNIIQIRAIIQSDAQRRANFLHALYTTCNASPIPTACGQINAAYAASAASTTSAPAPTPPPPTPLQEGAQGCSVAAPCAAGEDCVTGSDGIAVCEEAMVAAGSG